LNTDVNFPPLPLKPPNILDMFPPLAPAEPRDFTSAATFLSSDEALFFALI
jgi:hypothetical protein